MESVLTSPPRHKKFVSDGVIGMIFLLATEAMFFAGLISAYIVNRAGAMVWPPYGQPRLPVEVTAVNTVILVASAVTIFFFKRKFKSLHAPGKSIRLLLVTIFLGGTFIAIQGTEWMKLIQFGLTTTSSIYGAFFYLIIGAHAFHVAVGLALLVYLFYFLRRPVPVSDRINKITVCSMYWYFVVAIWPVLYVLVYLM